MNKQDFGMIGLGVMGQKLAQNIERHGYSVAGYDLDPEKRVQSQKTFAGKKIQIYSTLTDFLSNLNSPKKIMMMVPAGKPVDSVIRDLKPFLKAGDIIIDGGNSFFRDTIQRTKELEESGILFIGAGVSGGEEGALWGPSLMPGGNPDAWPAIKPIFQSIAAKVADGTPCCDWVGSNGAGHFVKMVHNGIEYGDMQMISEAYALLKGALDMTPAEMQPVFAEWNKGELDSYLIKITADILGKTDAETGKPMVDVILDAAGQKGTGRWTSQEALNLGVPAPTVVEAVMARAMSAIKEERVEAAKQLHQPAATFSGDRGTFIEKIRQALYASKICSYAQGFQILRTAAREYHWDLNYGSIALMWREGCIIRAQFLEKIKDAYDKNPALPNLLLDDYFRLAIEKSQQAWRSVVAEAARLGIPLPAFSSALAYYDGYRSERLPANLLQAQRDYFGAHTYERVDRPRGEFFHTRWTDKKGEQ